MGFNKENIKVEVRLTIPSGGEIDSNYLDFRIDECMKQIFTESEVLVLPRYIAITNDKKIQECDLSKSSVSMLHAPTGGDTIQFMNLYKVEWEDGVSDKDRPSNVKTRTLVNPSTYYIGFSDDSDWTNKIIFNTKQQTSEYETLELWAAMSSTESNHVDEMFSHNFSNALISCVKYYLLGELGKPWFSADGSQIEFAKYKQELGKLKIKSKKGFTNKDVKLKPASFI